MIEDSIHRFLEEVTQLRVKKGPYYDKWLRNYKKSVVGKCVKIADHYKQHSWLEGMNAFLQGK